MAKKKTGRGRPRHSDAQVKDERLGRPTSIRMGEQAHAALNDISEALMANKRDVLSALVLWWSHLDRATQMHIIRTVPKMALTDEVKEQLRKDIEESLDL